MEYPEQGNWSSMWEIEDTDEQGFGTQGYYEWYGVGLIVVVAVGCLGNLSALAVFLHPNMRSPYGVYVCAMLITDVVFLVCSCLSHVPGAWLTHISAYDDQFWGYLSRGQDIYVAVYGVTELAQALVIWYTVALLAEQYCVIYKPAATLRFSSTSEKVVKICITILNLVILVHLVHFFKYLLKPINIEDFKRICLSDIYTNSIYRSYDVYVYFICFGLSAWLIAVVFTVAIALAVITSRYNIGEVLPDQKIFRVFKNGRSIRTTLAVGVWYIVCFSVANICYIATWFYDPWDSSEVDCHFRPGEKRFRNIPDFLGVLHDVFSVLNSSLRFPMMFAANSNFRRILMSCFRYRPPVAETVSSILASSRINSSTRLTSLSSRLTSVASQNDATINGTTDANHYITVSDCYYANTDNQYNNMTYEGDDDVFAATSPRTVSVPQYKNGRNKTTNNKPPLPPQTKVSTWI